MTEAVPAIEATNLSKRFGESTVVRQLSFKVRSGEVFGFLGPNGGGKTTTVRMLIGLLVPSEGSARLLGERVGDSDELRRRIGVMTETPGLYESLTVEENLAYFADLHGITGTQRRSRLDTCLEQAGLSKWRDVRAGALSKGLKQRAALARALVGDPEILFLDEPTAGLDPEAIADVRRLIKTLHRSGVTVFLITHRLEEAARVCDRVAIINTHLLTIGCLDKLTRGRNLEIKVGLGGPPSTDLIADLSSLAGVLRASPAGWGLALEVESRAAVPEAVRFLAARDEEVFSVIEVAKTLEEAYLELVGGEQ